MPKTANETFRDFFLRRQHFIQRYENGVLRDMALSFRQAYPELQARMLNLQNVIPAPGTGFTQQFRIQRMRAQLADMQGIMNTAAINSSNHLTQVLADFAHVENQAIAGMYAQQFGKVGISFTQLPFRQIDSILQEPLIWQRRGISIADVMLENVDKAMAQIRGELTQSIILGDDMAQAAKRLTGTVGRFTGLTAKQLARRTEVIARSEIQNVAAQVSRQITQENNDVLKSVTFSASLDSRTCKICISLDGGVHRLNPETGQHTGPLIPVHPLCRCVYVANSYSWQELAKRHNVPFDKRQKAFFDGAVTKTITYDAWLKTLSTAEQVEILGPARQKLWKSGEIKLSQMATSKRILTIEQLEAIAERELVKKPVISWKPTMTKAEADIWAKDSILKQSFFHGTIPESGASIRKEGFKIKKLSKNTGNGGTMGAGHYTAENEVFAAYGKDILEIKIKAEKVLDYAGSWNAANAEMRQVIAMNHITDAVASGFWKTIDEALAHTVSRVGVGTDVTYGEFLSSVTRKQWDKYINMSKTGGRWGQSLAEREIMKDLGFDAVAQYVEFGGKRIAMEMAVFNDKNIVVIVK